MNRMFSFIAALGVASLSAAPSYAGMDEGIAALKRQDYATAATELRPEAERGNAEAQYRVGLMYEYGKGYPLDKSQGVTWFRKAAMQGHVAAQVELAVIYATGDGVKEDDAQAVSWFRKAAEQGNAIGQYNLGLLYAKGQGIPRDDVLAIAWFRESADNGYPGAQFKLGVAYENGEGVAKDHVLAYVNYAIAARGGADEYVAHRDDAARALTAAQLKDAKAIVAAWQPGRPMPMRGGTSASGVQVAAAASASDKCSATGAMEGEKFTATHCAISLYGDQHSVAIWFNEDAITPDEAVAFQLSSYAGEDKAGKRRTRVQIMFCPGGGSSNVSPSAVKSIDFNTSHAKSAFSGVQWVVEAPKDFKVEKLSGKLEPGGTLSGRIVGQRAKTSWTFDFDLNLPTKDSAAGMSCGK
ncbi:MAG TPA: tetratricopeptide repeat protein [Casimicrobiaceae bacterium]